ncbi:MAG: class I SAM-dependent methyltransferase [Planctomycetota bacterium]
MDDLALLRDTDVYLVDLVLRGLAPAGPRIVDVGSGGGRNLPWFVARGCDVVAVEPRPEGRIAVDERLAAHGLDPGRVQHVEASVEDADLPPGSADLVVSCAVLHFARDHEHFTRMLDATWRLVAPGGLLFARLASSVGIEDLVLPLGGGVHRLPDESDRYLVDERTLLDATERMGGTLVGPIKSTVVQRLRTMTTWVVARPPRD